MEVSWTVCINARPHAATQRVIVICEFAKMNHS
jgi:hypothetical protein